ncbi:MAG: S-adenosylmethionine:tRNA ribosyltransferase-isomerase [Bacteroidales bacterium]|nr:S-adenosylmethionine:tRNA ribosyltransferase-isomerase [Bacteroidales bacterium]
MLSDLQALRIEDYNYPLPDERIARYPLAERDHSKLLCLKGDAISEHHFYDLPDLLPAGARLVFNDTRVIHARLLFHKETGAVIEIFCLEPHDMDVTEAFAQREQCTWTCFIGNNKKWKEGTLTLPFTVHGSTFTIQATRREAVGNAWVVEFNWTGGMSFSEAIEAAGVIPLPPYLGREAEADDATRYQTVYAHHDGSVAAPTAGLHFTPELLERLRRQGFTTDYVTLHVGAGTFKPVSTPTIGEHEMHSEHVVVDRSLIETLQRHDRPLVAVGTTSVRTLESLYWYGVRLQQEPDRPMQVGQWDPYTFAPVSLEDALDNVLRQLDSQHTDTLVGATQLMIAPGYRYRVVDGLVTNFHQPKSTLLLLVSALIGDRWRECYRFALDHGFRFLSYGDSCLFLP